MKRLALVLPLLAAAALVTSAAEVPAPPGPCGHAQRTGRWTQLLQSGGIKRYALVNVPPHASSSRPMPLVLVLHGAGGNGRDMDSWTGFSRVADSRGFAAVYPSAAGKFWNITQSPGKADDVAYMRALLDNLESQVCIDPDRVFATGVSNGGGMTGLLGCAMSDRLAAIAPVAGNYRPLPACKPERPVSMLEIHGTADIAVPYSIVPAWVNQWLRLDACPSGTHASRPAPRVLHYDAGPCASGTRVGHVELFGEPHGWPGSANWTVWGFFSGLRRAPAPAST